MARKRQSFFTEKEMRRLLRVKSYQNYVHMPNEIYSDFSSAFAELKDETDVNTRSSHVAYAFCYTFLAHYMWRYAQYYSWDDKKGEVPINEAIIKQLLGFPAKSEAYTYLTKNKVGILEQIGYIRKVTDKPISYYWDEDGIELYFEMESESNSPKRTNHKGWKVAMPIKGIWRKPEDATTSGYETGTFHLLDNTHMVHIETFIFCITHPELGVEGFYLYCFLCSQFDKFPRGYDCSKQRMARLTGLSIDEVKKQLENLERYNMITNDHKPWCYDKPDDKETKANTYTVLDYSEFAHNLMQLNTIPKQRRISAEEYERTIGWANEKEIADNIVDINTGEIIRPAEPKFSVENIDISDLDDLPFDFR
ncbi:hypothetical protein AWM70_18615 [Paenibacillus yonginensis]|uniref:Uncharacterized protein n=1 Tax=Paenibacillus yonginensis TaxID=1462996 RepID=A0A1B1N4J8_9BACL|nr:hypothetical protein [Paenibacillus yonginensis]ANS76337.1 hypothetical protein AWM70_18615 [Paenibacillus yonginensis]